MIYSQLYALTYPLRTLTAKNSDFIWIGNCEKVFDTLKNILTSDSCIQYYDEKKPAILYCDASPVRISAFFFFFVTANRRKCYSLFITIFI